MRHITPCNAQTNSNPASSLPTEAAGLALEPPCPCSRSWSLFQLCLLPSDCWGSSLSCCQPSQHQASPNPEVFCIEKRNLKAFFSFLIIENCKVGIFQCTSTSHDVSLKNIYIISSAGEPAQLLGKALLIGTTQTQTQNQMLRFLDLEI